MKDSRFPKGKLSVEIETVPSENSVRLHLEQFGNSVAVVMDGDGFWLAEFKIEDNQLVITRNMSVSDPRVKTDSQGRIVEVKE